MTLTPIPAVASVRRRLAFAGLCAAAVFLTGCSGLSGLGGSEFACKAPEGIPCQSISGVHYNERAGNLPSQRPARTAETTATGEAGKPASITATANAGAAPLRKPELQTTAARIGPAGFGALRSEPTVVRVWIAPWEDADGDLNDQTYVYMQVDSGRWLIEHNRAQIRREFAPGVTATVTPRPIGVTGPAVSARPADAGGTSGAPAGPAAAASSPSTVAGTAPPPGRPSLPPELSEAIRRAAERGTAGPQTQAGQQSNAERQGAAQ